MTAVATVPTPPVGTAADVDVRGPGDPGDRGTTVVADRVVARIAAQAATEVDHAGGLRRSLAGRGVGSTRVRAQADVDGSVAALRLDLAVEYPAPIRQVTRAVRQHVVATVGTLCGMTVDHVDITVASVRRPVEATRRRVV